MKRFGKILRYVLFALLCLVLGIILVRVIISSDESMLKTITPTDEAKAAFAALPEGEAFAVTHGVPYQVSQKIHDKVGYEIPWREGEEDREERDGYFTAYGFVYIPSAKQLQVVVRYNNAILRNPGTAQGDDFRFTLWCEETDTEIAASSVETAAKWMYQYRRLVFDGVELNDHETLWLLLRTDGAAEPLNKLLCHYPEQYNYDMKTYKLSGAERRALQGE